KLKIHHQSLPCKIIQKKLAGQFDVLEDWYSTSELEPLETSNYPPLNVVPLNSTISLWQAGFKQNFPITLNKLMS
ncbi:9383_t:CDS:1, partial [Cetraspora pellucida]